MKKSLDSNKKNERIYGLAGEMFLRKSKSRTELFVLLPNKPGITMSPTNAKQERIKNERNCVKGSLLRDEVEKEEPKKEVIEKEIINNAKKEDENNNALQKELSNLMLVQEGKSLKGSIRSNGRILDIMKIGEKYDQLKHNNLKHEFSEFKCKGDSSSDHSVTSSDDSCKSPTRISPKGRKSVRFEDEMSDHSTDGGVLSVPKRHDYNGRPNNNEKTVNRMSSCPRQRNTSSSLTQQNGMSERGGMLARTLSQNPLNIKRENRYSLTDCSFRCHQCNKAFKYQSNLKSHVITVHGGALIRSGSQTNLRSLADLLICDVCSLVFKYSVNLRAHKAGHARNKLNATI